MKLIPINALLDMSGKKLSNFLKMLLTAGLWEIGIIMLLFSRLIV